MLKRIKDEGVEHVLFWFTDLEGHLKSFAITPTEMEGALDDGMGFDGSSITGFNAIEESDMVAIPDPATFQIMPRPVDEHGHELGAKVGRMICDVVKPDGTPYEGDPRLHPAAALERMKKLGFDTFNVGPELEYFLFEDDKGTKTLDEGGYFAMTAQDAATEVRNDTIHALESVGIPIEYHHHEVAPSQHEIDMRYDDALAMADHTMTYRLIVKEVAAWHGYYATFMPKPLFGENGSGMHTHMSLFKGGRNQFFDAKDPHHLSKTAKSFIAGLLVHAREHVRRARAVGQLVQAARARLRGAGLRRLVAAEPLRADPDPALQAGRRAGDAGRDPLPRPGLQPVPRVRGAAPRRARGDRAGLRAARRDDDEPLPALGRRSATERGIVALPGSLGEAVEALAGSELMKQALGEHIFPRYVELKRREWDEYRIQVTRVGEGAVPERALELASTGRRRIRAADPSLRRGTSLDCERPGHRHRRRA